MTVLLGCGALAKSFSLRDERDRLGHPRVLGRAALLIASLGENLRASVFVAIEQGPLVVGYFQDIGIG